MVGALARRVDYRFTRTSEEGCSTCTNVTISLAGGNRNKYSCALHKVRVSKLCICNNFNETFEEAHIAPNKNTISIIHKVPEEKRNEGIENRNSQEVYKEGILHIIKLAESEGMLPDLWEFMTCFRRIKKL